MAPYQLFEIQSPLWALSCTAIEIRSIINCYNALEPEYKQMDDCVKLIFETKEQLEIIYAPYIREKLDERNSDGLNR